ncbi:MAG: DUF6612 family protein [Minisyncoccales bacterium]
MLKSRPIIKIVGILIGALLLIAIGVLVYAKIWQPWWSPFKIVPEKEIQTALWKMSKLNTLRTDVELNFESTEGKIDAQLISDLDISNSQKPKSISDLKVILSAKGYELTLGSKVINLTDEFYLKIENALLPYSLFLPKEWIKFDQESLKNLGLPVKVEKQDEKIEKLKKDLIELLKDKQLYLVSQVLPIEEINGKKNYHYVIVLNREELIKLAPDFSNLLNQYILDLIEDSPMPISAEEKAEMEETLKEKLPQGLTEFVNQVSQMPIELWIGKKDSYLYRLKTEQLIDITAGNQKQTLLVKININFSNFNQPVNIAIPQEVKPIDELLRELFLSYSQGLGNQLPLSE